MDFLQNFLSKTVNIYPHRKAVIFKDKFLTYQELDIRSSALASKIFEVSGTGNYIGISITKSLELIVGVFAILKSGNAYVPFDPAFPKGRIQDMINGSGVEYLLSLQPEAELWESYGLKSIPNIDSGFLSHFQELTNSVAAVLFTSGSTGKPKGVKLVHKGLIGHVNHRIERNKKRMIASGVEVIRGVQFPHFGFDVSINDLFEIIACGGELHVLDDDVRKDPFALINYIKEKEIHLVDIPYATLILLVLESNRLNVKLNQILNITVGGEVLKITAPIREFFIRNPKVSLINGYGPTEASISVTEILLEGHPNEWPELPPIGLQMSHAKLFILDNNLKEVKENQIGELFIGGDCLAEGYISNEELTKQKFISWISNEGETYRLYRTGDLVYRDNGVIFFRGREDEQIKIRGNRVELSEIEIAISSIPGILQAAVKVNGEGTGEKTIIGYYIAEENRELKTPTIFKELSEKLPVYMIPAQLVQLDQFPKTTSGKVDKKALTKLEKKRPEWLSELVVPTNERESIILSKFQILLSYDNLSVDDNFFELGGNSFLAQRAISDFRHENNFEIPITAFYKYPSAKGLAQFLMDGHEEELDCALQSSTSSSNSKEVAIIGMEFNFPGANTEISLLELLREGKKTISFFNQKELDEYLDQSLIHDPNFVAARGIIDGFDEFDSEFFGLTPKLGEIMDPQIRKFLEICYAVLEKTGYGTQNRSKEIGVFAGSSKNTYFNHNLSGHKSHLKSFGDFQVTSLNEKDYIASRVAYHLNLSGPAVSVYSACSTSLLAVAQAVEAIQSGKCSMALAGASSIQSPVKSGHIYEEGGVQSRDGNVNSFDQNANGTIFSDGLGVVLLKNLKQAIADRDSIIAVIKGVGVNNDGGDKGSFSSPSAEGQSKAISKAFKDSGVIPSDVTYIEAHATATPIGDPIEIDGLKMVFGKNIPANHCALGTIKANMGHLNAASGMAGLMKVLLSLKYKQLFPQVNFTKINPNINFKNSPFYVNTELFPWEVAEGKQRIAGISSLGVGGTNVHLILSEFTPKQEKPEVASENAKPAHLMIWSAKSQESTLDYAGKLNSFLEEDKDYSLNDVAYTLSHYRPEYQWRNFGVASTGTDGQIIFEIENAPSKKEGRSEIAFLFPGQGAQFIGMGAELYQNYDAFKFALDKCDQIIKDNFGYSIIPFIFPENVNEQAISRLNNTKYTQPAIFSIEYATSVLLKDLGVEPNLLCGHSVGEFVAAHLAGVFNLEDALKLVAERGRLISELSPGIMMSVRCSEEEIKPFLSERISLAGVNSAHQVVVAGEEKNISSLSKVLEEKGFIYRVLKTSHAFHSHMMEDALQPFRQMMSKIPLCTPEIPIMSTLTGDWLKEEEAKDVEYWVSHMRDPVRFFQAGTALFDRLENSVFIEAGPGKVLSSLLRQRGNIQGKLILDLLPSDSKNKYAAFLKTIGKLWSRGINIKFDQLMDKGRNALTIPTYAFKKKKLWINPVNRLSEIQNQSEVEKIQDAFSNKLKIRPMERLEHIKTQIFEMLAEAAGIESQSDNESFFEMGIDSLLLTQLVSSIRSKFNTQVTFKQLNSELSDVTSLAHYLDQVLPVEATELTTSLNRHVLDQAQSYETNLAAPSIQTQGEVGSNKSHLQLISKQLELLSQQIQILSGETAIGVSTGVVGAIPGVNTTPSAPKGEPQEAQVQNVKTVEEKKPKTFGAMAKIDKQKSRITQSQEAFLKDFQQRFNEKTKGSKSYTQQHRTYMADPRVVSGFKPATKEITYSIVVNQSKGKYLWDIDGNKYLDVLNGFGSVFLGHNPDFIKNALMHQINKGYEIGPQHELSGEVCKMIKEIVGHDRVALCNTGSEAVLGAVRMARTITGKSIIVSFNGSYHGIFDEVIVRNLPNGKSYPAAAGIMPEAVHNILVLDYGTEESLEIIRKRKDEIAAVLVEPVQSRRPEFVPLSFLKDVRQICNESGAALIFDEVITGFRMGLQGAQGIFGIKADIVSYGKVVGGGISIGVMAGNSRFMDALDGGFWQYGDDSVPEAGVTYFAGTFVRHPLALASTKASLEFFLEDNGKVQKRLNDLTSDLVKRLNTIFVHYQLPIKAVNFGSLWLTKYDQDLPFSDLIFALLREKGIHIYENFPCFLTLPYEKEDLDVIVSGFEESIKELVQNGFFADHIKAITESIERRNSGFTTPPFPGAKLGLDEKNNPSWFKEDGSDHKREYYKIDLKQ